MKKLFLIAMLSAFFALFFVVAVNAEAYDPQFGEVEEIDGIGVEASQAVAGYVAGETEKALVKLACACDKGEHTYPTYYILTINNSLRGLFNVDFTAINNANPCEAQYDKNSLIAVEIPEGITSFYGSTSGSGSGTLARCELLEYVKFSSTFTDISVCGFKGCTALEWVDMSLVTKMTALGASTFNGCSSLLGICLPDEIKTIGNAAFIGCYQLGPVHLPDSLETADNNEVWPVFHPKDGNSTASAPFNVHMYFVNETFDSPVGVEKPQVYYMPRNLTQLWGHGLRGFYNVNDVVVFGDKFTSFTCKIGFTSMDLSADNTKTVVFTADMQTVYLYSGNNYLNFYFTNPNDTRESDIGLSYPAGGSGGNAVLHLCASGIYKTISASEWSSEGYTHIVNAESSTVIRAADCENDAVVYALCYCGVAMGETSLAGTALGHSHTVDMGIVYENYFEQGYDGAKCERCDHVEKNGAYEALFTDRGISAKAFGDDVGFTCGYAVNLSAIEAYRAYTGSFDFGVLACANPSGGEMVPDFEDGRVIIVSFADESNGYVDVKVTGIPADKLDVKIVLCIYVRHGEDTYYLENGQTSRSVVGISYLEAENI